MLGTFISLLEAVRGARIRRPRLRSRLRGVWTSRLASAKAALDPEAYHIYDQTFHNLSIVWYWGALQSLDTERLKRWESVGPLTRLGGVDKYASRGVGDVPMNKLYVQPDHSLGPEATRYISMLPTVHNFDSFAYDLRVFNGGSRPRESWAMLFEPARQGASRPG